MSWGTKGECGQDSTRRRICLECAGDDIADGMSTGVGRLGLCGLVSIVDGCSCLP
jgi:hypothetical protein